VGEHVCRAPSAGRYRPPTRKAGSRLMLMIILIVLVLMFLLGGFGYSRRGRRGV
jgi:flagellar basal body-associated protein FliL